MGPKVLPVHDEWNLDPNLAGAVSAIVESSDDAILTKSLDGTIASWNRGAELLYGYTAAEAIGQSVMMLVSPENHAEEQDFLDRIRHGEFVKCHETIRRRRDGTLVDVSMTLSPIKNAQGEIIGSSAIARNISERMITEAALRASEKAFRDLTELVPQLIWKCTPDGLNIYFNQRWVEYTGLTREESYGTGWVTPFHPEDKPLAWRAWSHAVATGDTYRTACRLRAADGSYRWFLIKGVPVRDDTGNIGHWFGTCTDIDDLKKAEEEIRQLNQGLEERVKARTIELRESEQRVRKKLDSILSPEGDLEHLDLADIVDVPAVQALVDDMYQLTHIPVAIIDLQAKVLIGAGWQDICTTFHRTNPEACKNCIESDIELTADVAPGEFKLYKCKNNMWDMVTPITLGNRHIGNIFCGQFLFDDETPDAELFKAQAKKYNFDEQAYLSALNRVPRLRHETVRTVMAFYSKLADLLSQLGYSGIKLGRAMTETSRANSDLLVSSKEMEAFAYSVSHDLRAPLRHMDGFLTLLSKRCYADLDTRARHYIDCTLDASQRMGRLIDELLQFSRLGRAELRKVPVSLNEIVNATRKELEPESHNRAIEWHIESLPVVDADQGMLRQVIENLIANALKFTKHKDPAIIGIGTTLEQNGDIVISVHDNGAGFDMQYYNKLFQVFQRLHGEDEFEGTGIGLADVRRIVERHGGRAWAEATVNGGATFSFSLPAAAQQNGGQSEYIETHLVG